MSKAKDVSCSGSLSCFKNYRAEDEIDVFENSKYQTKEPNASCMRRNGDKLDIGTNRIGIDSCQALRNISDDHEKNNMTSDDNDEEKKDKSKMSAANNSTSKKADVLKEEICQSANATEQQHESVVAKPIPTDNYIDSDQLDGGIVLRVKKKTPRDISASDKTNRFGYFNIGTGKNMCDISVRKDPVLEKNNSESNYSFDDDTNSTNYDDLDTCRLRKHKNQPRPATIITRSYRNSIINYTYETFCGEDGEACNVGECCAEVTNTTNTQDRRSSIEFMVSNDFTELGGMNLYSSMGSHFIEITEPDNNYTSRMSLRHSDKLLALNNLPVDHYQHNIVLELLRNIVHSSIVERTSLIVERQEQNGDTEILEIKVQAEITECEEAPIVKIKTEVCYSRTYNLGITYVRLQNKFDCKVNISETNLYVVADKRKIHVKTLHHGDNRKREEENCGNIINMEAMMGTFTCYVFSGLYMDRRGHEPNPIFIGVFQSCENDKYIMASSKSKLSLVSADRINTSMDKIVSADARFFIISKTGRGQSFFESLLYPGSFWASKGKVLELVTDSTRNVLRKQSSQFDLIQS